MPRCELRGDAMLQFKKLNVYHNGDSYVVEDAYKLSDRIHAVVQRTGSWEVYMRMTAADFPFVQKRFFEAYRAHDAVEAERRRQQLSEGAVPMLKSGDDDETEK